MMKLKNYKSHKNLFAVVVATIFSMVMLLPKTANAQAQKASNKVTGESESELEIRNLSYLAQQTKNSKKVLDEGKSSEIMRQNYKTNVNSFVERMLMLSLKLKTPNQAKNFNQVKNFFAGFEPKLAAQIPTASVSKDSSRRLASEQ